GYVSVDDSYRRMSGRYSQGDFSPSTYSTAPMSQAPPCGRKTPRWSGERQPEPPSIARLTCGDCSGNGICVSVGPPLLASGPKFGFAVFQSTLLLKLHDLSMVRMLSWDDVG